MALTWDCQPCFQSPTVPPQGHYAVCQAVKAGIGPSQTRAAIFSGGAHSLFRGAFGNSFSAAATENKFGPRVSATIPDKVRHLIASQMLESATALCLWAICGLHTR
jgi:hypothetical protein